MSSLCKNIGMFLSGESASLPQVLGHVDGRLLTLLAALNGLREGNPFRSGRASALAVMARAAGVFPSHRASHAEQRCSRDGAILDGLPHGPALTLGAEVRCGPAPLNEIFFGKSGIFCGHRDSHPGFAI